MTVAASGKMPAGSGRDNIIDSLPLGPMQILILTLTFAITLSDGADLQLLAFAAPPILADWGVSKASFTPALAAALLGMIIGAFGGGYLGDRIGRKRTLLLSVALMGCATIATGFAVNIPELTLIRFVGGIGFGATTPTAYALGVEVLPHRSRTWASALLSLANAIGGLVGSFIALIVIPSHGWQGAFYVSGAISLFLGVLIFFFVPESAGFLLAKGRDEEANAAFRYALGRKRVPAGSVLALAETPKAIEKATHSVFSNGYRRTTLGAWLVYFATAFTTYACLNWVPTLLTNNQWMFTTAVKTGSIFNASALLASILVAVGAGFFGSRNLIYSGAFATIIGALWMPFIIPLGSADQVPVLALMMAVALIGYGSGALMSANLAVVGQAYPLPMRSRGVGYALSWARIGSTTATLTSGAILYYTHDNLMIFFGSVAVVGLLIAVGGSIINMHVPSRLRLSSSFRWKRQPL